MADPLVIDESVPRVGCGRSSPVAAGGSRPPRSTSSPTSPSSAAAAPGSTTSTWPPPAERGIAVVNAPGATTAAVAEHAVLLMLGLARRIAALDAAVKAGQLVGS